MIKTVKIIEYEEINCNNQYCSITCEHFNRKYGFCGLFSSNLKLNGKRYERCNECLNAEEV
jgi:hypothetical protein